MAYLPKLTIYPPLTSISTFRYISNRNECLCPPKDMYKNVHRQQFLLLTTAHFHDTNEHIYETQTDSQTWRTDLWLTRRGRGGKDWEFGISRCKLLYIGWINNKVLLYSTDNYIQYSVINHNGKEYEKEYIYMYN